MDTLVMWLSFLTLIDTIVLILVINFIKRLDKVCCNIYAEFEDHLVNEHNVLITTKENLESSRD